MIDKDTLAAALAGDLPPHKNPFGVPGRGQFDKMEINTARDGSTKIDLSFCGRRVSSIHSNANLRAGDTLVLTNFRGSYEVTIEPM